MSPRVKMPFDCPHGERDQYYSIERGTLTLTIICHHAENDGCWCECASSVDECELWSEQEETLRQIEQAEG